MRLMCVLLVIEIVLVKISNFKKKKKVLAVFQSFGACLLVSMTLSLPSSSCFIKKKIHFNHFSLLLIKTLPLLVVLHRALDCCLTHF